MPLPRGRAQIILPSWTCTQATVSIRTGMTPSDCLAGLQLPDHLQRVADVLADVGHGVEAVADRALAVDHVGDPAGQQAQERRNPVELADLTALVAEQREGQLVFAGEGGVLSD